MASGSRATPVTVSERQRKILERIVRSKRSPRELVERGRIFLMSSEGRDNPEQARRLGEGVDRQRVRRWRNRWAASETSLAEAEAHEATEKDLENRVLAVLSDNPRSGAPATFTPEQLTRILAVACEPPSDSDVPISHWTPAELTREVIKRGIVESISPRHVDRFLRGGRYTPPQEQVLDDVQGQARGSRPLSSQRGEGLRYLSERTGPS
jgi:putative transposase